MIQRLSLQSRLMILLAILLGLLWGGLEIAVRSTAQTQADMEREEEIRATADLLAAVSIPQDLDIAERRTLFEVVQLRRHAPIDKAAYELVGADGVILRSAPFPEFPGPTPSGVVTALGEEDAWRVLTVFDVETGMSVRAALSDTARDERANDLRGELAAPWAIALPVFAIAVLISVWVGLRPLRQMERRMTAISPYDPAPLGLDSARMPREIGALARSFDKLAELLARVMSDQRIFASAASHELRTPLAGALSQLDVLRRAPGRRETLDHMGTSLSHMDQLITQLLFLVRSDTVAASNRPEPIDLPALAREAGRELDLTPQIEGEGAVTGYPDLLRSLLRSLLHNAHTAAKDEMITVVIAERGDMARVSVLDRGPGIPEMERHRLLEPFQRGHAKQDGGAGLGLTVAQRIAELHGGWIEITDRPQGGAIVTALLGKVIRTNEKPAD